MLSNLALCNVLRRAGYKPYAQVSVFGRKLELISYPFPTDQAPTRIACMVREPNDPTTMFAWSVPDHVIKAAVESFG